MSSIWQEDIDVLMEAFGQTVRSYPGHPRVTDEELKLREELIREECNELLEALQKKDFENIAKEIVDVLVVTIGAASSIGYDLTPLWDLVHESNMAKAGGPKDPNTGKQLKPEGWQKPNILKELRRQGWAL